jgi:hypothetical protein
MQVQSAVDESQEMPNYLKVLGKYLHKHSLIRPLSSAPDRSIEWIS